MTPARIRQANRRARFRRKHGVSIDVAANRRTLRAARRRRDYWTDHEDTLLLILVAVESPAALAARLGRTLFAVAHRIKLLRQS